MNIRNLNKVGEVLVKFNGNRNRMNVFSFITLVFIQKDAALIVASFCLCEMFSFYGHVEFLCISNVSWIIGSLYHAKKVKFPTYDMNVMYGGGFLTLDSMYQNSEILNIFPTHIRFLADG